MRIRLLTTAAAIALFAATVAPNLALAAGEAPSSSSGAATGTSTSTGGSLSEPAGIDSNATTPPVYAPTSGAGSPPVSAGTGSGSSGASGPLGNSASPTLTPSSGSSSGSGTVGAGMNSTGTSTGYSATGSSVLGSTVYPTPGVPGTVSMPLESATGGRATYDSTYIGAPYETSMGGTEHYSRTLDGTQPAFEGESRYDALASEIRESAGDTRGMADRNGSGVVMEDEFYSTIRPSGGQIMGDRTGGASSN